MILVVTQLTAPAASLTNPFDQTWLVRALHRSIASTRAQQLPLKETDSISEASLLLKARHSMAHVARHGRSSLIHPFERSSFLPGLAQAIMLLP